MELSQPASESALLRRIISPPSTTPAVLSPSRGVLQQPTDAINTEKIGVAIWSVQSNSSLWGANKPVTNAAGMSSTPMISQSGQQLGSLDHPYPLMNNIIGLKFWWHVL